MPDATRSYIQLVLYGYSFLYDVMRRALNLWRHPLSFILFLWLTSLLYTPLFWVTTATLKPLCSIPGIQQSRFCSANHYNATIHPDFPRLMDAQTITFEQLLDNSVGGSGLSLEIKKAEMAVVDLITLVEYSELSNRQILVESLTLFTEDARLTGRGLQIFVAKVAGAVDLITAVNECAIRTLSSIQSLPSFSLLSFAIIQYPPPPYSEKIVREAFIESMTTLSALVENLILLAEVQLMNIDRLEEHLSIIHALRVREDSAISLAKAELLGDIWTLLGGNRRMLKGYDRNLELLRGVGGVRMQAWAHITSALHLLRQLRDDMEVMEETLSRPSLTGSHISVEVHMKSIELGVERLKESKALARRKEGEDMNKRVSVGEGAKIIYVTS
ncbi:hypothetical protein BT96DRAFT_844466 [Gymnopus androsaceus JB14]|uniref:Uncharacterized protein n=1 Tax=Gymnopus androsaceus JB14 TaxID=1447944 RepID=A0A6A4GCM6_9AGAR|nr:hypothetical protein BT96DRAFT_844466 [Gymnopus androsaceus JB14]